MCGIVGIVNREKRPVDDGHLDAMMGVLRHRGPDASGKWRRDHLALGHLRLSIIDLTNAGNQPFVTENGRSVIVYNGEIYNFKELRKELAAEGINFRSNCDTEVVAYAIERWGAASALKRFNGMFALAQYDSISGQLLLARDRLGIKPLYIYHGPQIIAFASEIKSLLALPFIAATPDMHSLSVMVMCLRLEDSLTPFVGIQSMTPGTYSVIESGRIENHVYYDVLDSIDLNRLVRAASDDRESEHAEHERLCARLDHAVELQMISDAPLAVLCSGGVDSSIVTAMMARKKRDLVGYVADLEGGESEGDRALVAGRALRVPINVIKITPEQFLRTWPRAVWHNDQPTYYPHDVPFFIVAQAVSRDGFKVVLTGEGADELFGGYLWQQTTFMQWRKRRRFDWLQKHLPGMFHICQLLGKLHPEDLRLARRLPFTYRPDLNRLSGSVTMNSESQYLPSCVVFGEQRSLRQEEIFDRLSGIDPIEDRAFLAQCVEDVYSQLQCLLQRNDKMGMAASIESRFPFIEDQVVDFALHLPRKQKLRNGVRKWLLRKVAATYLDESLVYAPKIGFYVHESHYLSGLNIVRDGILPELFKWGSRSRNQLLTRIQEAPILGNMLISIELWARIFLRSENVDELGERLVAAMH